MAMTPETDETKLASHTLAYLRTLDRKLDLVIETAQRHGERLGRVERDLGELKRDVAEVKGDIALLENRLLTNQNELLAILHRLDGRSSRIESQE
jgi:hypothetical protein